MIASPVSDPSQVSEARRAAVGLAKRNGYDDEAAGRVALVATELCTNLVKHGGGGHLLFDAHDEPDREGIQLIAIDRGSGIANLDAALRDGTSTAGTPGHGLGAIRRLSDAFDIFSRAGLGTAVLARVSRERRSTRPLLHQPWGAVSVPHPGEEVCGDDWLARSDDGQLTMMVADGLGHGPQAAEASAQAVKLFRRLGGGRLADILEAMHAGLRATRGAAVGIARLDGRARTVAFAGVGNIAGTIVAGDGQARRMLSHNGTLGHAARRFQAIDYPVDDPATTTLVLHSDGVTGNWNPAQYPGLFSADPSLAAAVLYRDGARGRDDATVLVARGSASP